MHSRVIFAIADIQAKLDAMLLLESNIEIVWAFEQLSKEALNKAAQIREVLETEQAKD